MPRRDTGHSYSGDWPAYVYQVGRKAPTAEAEAERLGYPTLPGSLTFPPKKKPPKRKEPPNPVKPRHVALTRTQYLAQRPQKRKPVPVVSDEDYAFMDGLNGRYSVRPLTGKETPQTRLEPEGDDALLREIKRVVGSKSYRQKMARDQGKVQMPSIVEGQKRNGRRALTPDEVAWIRENKSTWTLDDLAEKFWPVSRRTIFNAANARGAYSKTRKQ